MQLTDYDTLVDLDEEEPLEEGEEGPEPAGEIEKDGDGGDGDDPLLADSEL